MQPTNTKFVSLYQFEGASDWLPHIVSYCPNPSMVSLVNKQFAGLTPQNFARANEKIIKVFPSLVDISNTKLSSKDLFNILVNNLHKKAQTPALNCDIKFVKTVGQQSQLDWEYQNYKNLMTKIINKEWENARAEQMHYDTPEEEAKPVDFQRIITSQNRRKIGLMYDYSEFV